MFQKILHFIKYNNAFTIVVMAIFLGAGMSFAASPNLRDSVYSSSNVVTSVDNYRIVSANLDAFNFNLKINSVTDDNTSYYIGYSYKTISLKNSVWQDIDVSKTLTVSKESLGDKDLGLYVAKELGDNINYELSYLKDVQKLQKDAGTSKKIVTTEYSGLVGKLLNPKEEVIEGYNPIIPASAPEVVPTPEKPVSPDPSLFIENSPNYHGPVYANSTPTLDKSSVSQTVENMLTDYQKQKANTPPITPPSHTPPADNTPPPEPPPADTTAPIITLTGEASITLNVDDTYTEVGATATDNIDKSVTVTTSGSVDTTTAGTYTITYTAKDAAGNSAIPVTRTVIVNAVTPAPDTTAPIITLTGEASITLNVDDTYTEVGATATDNIDKSVTVTTSGSVDTTTAGTYTITYTAKDAAGNSAIPVTRTVTVNIVTPPPEPPPIP